MNKTKIIMLVSILTSSLWMPVALSELNSNKIEVIQYEEQKGPWLTIYSKYISRVFVDAYKYNPDKPIQVRDVVVLLRKSLEHKLKDVSSNNFLVYYENGIKKEVSGCWTHTGRSNILAHSNNISGFDCASILKQALKKLPDQIDLCRQYDKKFRGSHVSFIFKDISQIKCLIVPTSVREQATTSANTIKAHKLSYKIPSYLELHTNRLFDCRSYGTHLAYHSAFLNKNIRFFRYPLLLDDKTIVWEHKYLIKTTGFTYCWGAKRYIDEPERKYFQLNDGTVLLFGQISQLRVRLKDGSTDAPKHLVKIFKPEVIQKLINENGGEECTGEALSALGHCALAVKAGSPIRNPELKWPQGTTVEKDVYPYVIKGVDEILQTLF